MDQGNVNPYAPPETPSAPPEPPIHVVETTFRHVKKGSWVLSLMAGVYSVAYIAFTLLLLSSTSGDRTAGKYFLLNVPTLIALVGCILGSRRLGTYVCIAFACIHIAITIAMFGFTGADRWAIVVINTIMMVPILAIGLVAWGLEFQAKSNRKS